MRLVNLRRVPGVGSCFEAQNTRSSGKDLHNVLQPWAARAGTLSLPSRQLPTSLFLDQNRLEIGRSFKGNPNDALRKTRDTF